MSDLILKVFPFRTSKGYLLSDFFSLEASSFIIIFIIFLANIPELGCFRGGQAQIVLGKSSCERMKHRKSQVDFGLTLFSIGVILLLLPILTSL